VAGAPRPGRVNKEIVNVLLRIIDDSLYVLNRFVNELPQSAGVFNNEPLVTRSNCRFQILTQSRTTRSWSASVTVIPSPLTTAHRP